MSEDTSCGPGKDVKQFQKVQIIGMNQAKKTDWKQIAETTEIGSRPVQRIFKNWNLRGRNLIGKKWWIIVTGDHLNIWWNQIVKTEQ